MGVYIKGMAMPIDGFHHIICIYADGTVSTGGKEYKAIPVPPHGPLVDALDIINAFPDEYVFTNEQARVLTNYIIPAEKEGET